MAIIVDPDQMLHSGVSDLGLHCLQRPICPNTLGYHGMCSLFGNFLLIAQLTYNALKPQI